MGTQLTRSNGYVDETPIINIPMSAVIDQLTEQVADLAKRLAIMTVRAEMAERALAEHRAHPTP